MATSRFVCGEISRSIRLLHAVRPRRRPFERGETQRSHRGNTCRTRMNARSVLTPVNSSGRQPAPVPLPPRRRLSRMHPFSIRLSLRFSPGCFSLISETGEQRTIKRRKGHAGGDVDREEEREREISDDRVGRLMRRSDNSEVRAK